MPKRMAAIPLALVLTLAGAGAANAVIGPFVLADRVIKASNKEAQETPGHAQWCAAQRPGYRPQWNNWRKPDGTVTYCASPYYTPPWQIPYSQR